MGSSAIATRPPFSGAATGCSSSLTHRRPALLFLAVDSSRQPPPAKCAAVASPIDAVIAAVADPKKRTVKRSKLPKTVDATAPAAADKAPAGLDYNKVAAALENIFKLSPAETPGGETATATEVVKSRRRRRGKGSKAGELTSLRSLARGDQEQRLDAGTDLTNLNWRRVRFPKVLGAAEQASMFKLMQPMKAILGVKEKLQKDLRREPSDEELAAATNMSVTQLRVHLEVGRAARDKLIKHNLRLVPFAINKYFSEFSNDYKFDDLCQAGAIGLMKAINRFDPKRGFRLSTYSLFWIRHSIARSMHASSFTRIPLGMDAARLELQKAKMELLHKLGRKPTDEEIIEKMGVTPGRYRDILMASKPVLSLHARHAVTKEEFINGITDHDDAGADHEHKQLALRLALDDVLDSIKPKESLVIRQRFGLDGKGERSLGEVAGNLNISREMVRKHELKALMKLKHPARADYVRGYL